MRDHTKDAEMSTKVIALAAGLGSALALLDRQAAVSHDVALAIKLSSYKKAVDENFAKDYLVRRRH